MKTFAHSFFPLHIFAQLSGLNPFLFPWKRPKEKVRLSLALLLFHVAFSNIMFVWLSISRLSEIKSGLDQFRVLITSVDFFFLNLYRITELSRRANIWIAMKNLHEVDVIVGVAYDRR